MTHRQTITRSDLCVVLLALAKKHLGVKLHLVTDSELIHFGLQGKCGKPT